MALTSAPRAVGLALLSPWWQRGSLWLVGALLLAFALALPARAQQPADADPPGRVARLNLAEGALSFSPAGTDEWSAAPYNRPLTDGDRLWAPERARAELDTGNALIHMDGQTSLVLTQVDDQIVQLQLTQGSLRFRLKGLYSGDRFEVDTPNLAFVASTAGEYRIDVDPTGGSTRVRVISGGALLYGENGGSAEVDSGRQVAFSGRNLDPVSGQYASGSDSFDAWAVARNRAVDQSQAARYVAPGTVGYSQLDQFGNWQTDTSYGPVWYPSSVPAGWAPYRDGQWSYIEPWGWTWVDDAPWGFAPFHYGRWVQSGSRWGWVPGSTSQRAYYAPALVAFGGNGNVSWQIGAGESWFPLAPGEPWWPGYGASDRYIGRFNHGIDRDRDRWRDPDRFRYWRQPGAITSAGGDRWDRGRPVRGQWQGRGSEPPRAPFAQPPAEIRGPWPGGDHAPHDPRQAGDYGRRFGGVPVINPNHPIPIKPGLEAAPARPLPRPQVQPQLPIQREVVRDVERYRQQEAQQAQRQFGDAQRGNVPGPRLDELRQRQLEQRQQDAAQRAQFNQRQDHLRQQQDQFRQQQDYQRQQQQQQQQQIRQQQFQQQQQGQNQMHQQQLQQRVLREQQQYEQQEQRARQMQERQNRGVVPP